MSALSLWLCLVLFALPACEGSSASDPPAAAPPQEIAPEPPAPHPLPMSPSGTSALACASAPAGMGCVPGGPMIRGFDGPDACPQPEGPPKPVNHQPAAQVWVQTFYMDTTEVTFESYKACEKAGRCDKAGPRYNDFSRARQPMIGANWFNARKFCEAQGKHLPTEAEWEKAARGPEGELEPWGNEPASCETAVIMDEKGRRSCGVQKAGNNPEKGRTWEVAQKPAGRYGLFDMVGNGEEWVADWYESSFTKCGESCLGENPLGPCKGAETCAKHSYKVVKGGSWFWPASCATGYNRRPHFPANQPYHHFGFRCAASAEEAARLTAAQAAPTP